MANSFWGLLRENPAALLRIEHATATVIIFLSCCAWFFSANLNDAFCRFIFFLSGIWILFGFFRGIVFAVSAGKRNSQARGERAGVTTTTAVVSELVWFMVWFRLTPVLAFISVGFVILFLGDSVLENPMLGWAFFVASCVFIPPAVRRWFARRYEQRLLRDADNQIR